MNVYHLVRGGGKVFKNPKCFLLEKSCKTRIIIWHQPKQFTSIFGKFLQFTIYLHYLFDLPKKKWWKSPCFFLPQKPKKKHHMFSTPRIFMDKILFSPRDPGEAQAHDQGRQRYGNLVRRGFIIQPQKPTSSKANGNVEISPLGMGMNGNYCFPMQSKHRSSWHVRVEIIQHFEGTQNFAFSIMYHVPKILWQLHFSYFQWSTHEGSLPHWALDNTPVKCPHSEKWGDTSSVGVPSEQFAKNFFTRNWCKTAVNQQGHLASTTNLLGLHRTNPSEEPNHPCKVLVYSNKGESAPITQGWSLAVWTIWLSCCRKKKGAA